MVESFLGIDLGTTNTFLIVKCKRLAISESDNFDVFPRYLGRNDEDEDYFRCTEPGPNFKCINPSDFIEIMNHKSDSKFDDLIIIDCRFEYEYIGGHIVGAINVTSRSKLIDMYDKYKEKGEKTCFVFYCEFGRNRSGINWFSKHRPLNFESFSKRSF